MLGDELSTFCNSLCGVAQRKRSAVMFPVDSCLIVTHSPQRIRTTVAVTSVPTTVRIAGASDTIFVTILAGEKVELTDLSVAGDIKRLVLRRDVECAHRFWGRSLEYVQQIGVHFSPIVHPLRHFVNVTSGSGRKVNGDDLLVGDMSVDDEAREDDVSLVKDGSVVVLRDGRVH